MTCLKCRQGGESSEMHYGLHLSCFKEWFNVSHAAEFMSLQNRAGSSDKDISHTPANTSFFHGRYKKYSAVLESSSYILKMRQEGAEELPEVEYLSNQIGRQLGVPVAEFYFINFHGDRTFVTKNFITASALPMDLQHIYHFRPDKEHSCAGIIKAIIENTKKPYDVRVIIKVILFDALIGNHDRHGRNLAFIAKPNQYMLSPIYDNVSYLALEKGDMLRANHNPTGKINTSETYEPSMRHYVKEFKKLGYEEDVKDFYKNLKLDEVVKLIEESFCSELMKYAIQKLVKERYEEIKNELLN